MKQIINRFEFKYRMRRRDAFSLYRQLLNHGMGADLNAKNLPEQEYLVNSLYFDTPDRSDFYDKLGGYFDRKKIRVRIYDTTLTNNTPEIWLEKKIKNNMSVSKKRLFISQEEYSGLISGFYHPILSGNHDRKTCGEIMTSVIRDRMRPIVAVSYKRKPLVSQHKSDVRITFDYDINACYSSDLRYNHITYPVLGDTVVMEVKYSTILPLWIGKIIHSFGVSRDAYSKYALSVDKVGQLNPLPR